MSKKRSTKQSEKKSEKPIEKQNDTFSITQVNITFMPEEDRLLFAMNTVENEQFRIFLTRRWIKVFWPQLTKILEAEPTIAAYDEEARNAALAFQHEVAMENADFEKPFETEGMTFPWGELPLVATEIRYREPPNELPAIGIYAANGIGIEFACGHKILHYFYRILPVAVQRADWDMILHTNEEMLPTGSSSNMLN